MHESHFSGIRGCVASALRLSGLCGLQLPRRRNILGLLGRSSTLPNKGRVAFPAIRLPSSAPGGGPKARTCPGGRQQSNRAAESAFPSFFVSAKRTTGEIFLRFLPYLSTAKALESMRKTKNCRSFVRQAKPPALVCNSAYLSPPKTRRSICRLFRHSAALGTSRRAGRCGKNRSPSVILAFRRNSESFGRADRMPAVKNCADLFEKTPKPHTRSDFGVSASDRQE